jgi:hypothetical protein
MCAWQPVTLVAVTNLRTQNKARPVAISSMVTSVSVPSSTPPSSSSWSLPHPPLHRYLLINKPLHVNSIVTLYPHTHRV